MTCSRACAARHACADCYKRGVVIVQFFQLELHTVQQGSGCTVYALFGKVQGKFRVGALVGQGDFAIGKGGLNIRLSKMLTGYDIDVYREVEEEDVDLNEFKDEIDAWIIDALKAVGCDTAKSVLELSVEEIASRADLEMEQAQKVVEILKAEFE